MFLYAPESFELMAVLAVGHPTDEERTSTRRSIREMAFNEKFGIEWVERDEEIG